MHPSPDLYFDHEKLVAYQRAIQFVAWTGQLSGMMNPEGAEEG